jgi:hypothetical protein
MKELLEAAVKTGLTFGVKNIKNYPKYLGSAEINKNPKPNIKLDKEKIEDKEAYARNKVYNEEIKKNIEKKMGK